MINKNSDPNIVSEDDNLRSFHIQELVHENTPKIRTEISPKIPKVIIQFWHNLNEIPDDVQTCLESWKILREQEYKRILFDTKAAKLFIERYFGDSQVNAFNKCNHPAMQCDYFRLCYILVKGGFYVDVDEIYSGKDINYLFTDYKLKLQPLCYEISTGMMINPERFMVNRESSNDWIFYLNNNPIIAPPQHPIIRSALERATNKLLNINNTKIDIQSTTGPGNLTASLVRHSIISKLEDIEQDFYILPNWETISKTQWILSYRNDERNWRKWDSSKSWYECKF